VKLWDAQTGKVLRTFQGTSWGVAFSPDGKRLASVAWDDQRGELKVWDTQTGGKLFLLKGHVHRVISVAFSADGKRLASVAYDEEMVKVGDAQTGQELLTLQGGKNIRRVAFSPNGHRLAGGSADGTVTSWDATPLPEKP
jgi:WD40 repeat protein